MLGASLSMIAEPVSVELYALFCAAKFENPIVTECYCGDSYSSRLK